MDFYNKHYVRLDNNNNVIYGFSNAFEKAQYGDIVINELGGVQFEILGIPNLNLQNVNSVWLYKYIDGQVIAKTPEEIQIEIDDLPKPKPEPSIEEILLEQDIRITLLDLGVSL